MSYVPRHLEKVFEEARHGKSVVAVTGARQTGKSTMLHNYLGDIKEISFDDVRQRNLAITDPALFIGENLPPLFIDEIQYAPEILPFIKIKADKQKEKNMYFLSGSQKFNLMKNMTESLAGRVAIFELLGFSMREFLEVDFTIPFLPTKAYLEKRAGTVKQYDIWEHVHKGSYPEMLISGDIDWNFFYSDYIKTYIERDIYQLTQIGDELKFYRFMEVLAARIGCILNLNEVCKEVGVSHSTAERWLSILRVSNIVYLLRPYANNLTKRAIRSPKLYFLDTGLAAYLTHWETKDVLKSGAKSGDFFENFVLTEILKSYYNAGREPNNLYYYRDKDKREIDVLIERNGILHPIEIKKSSNPNKGDCTAFTALSDKATIGEGAIVCRCDELMPITEKVRAIPVEWI